MTHYAISCAGNSNVCSLLFATFSEIKKNTRNFDLENEGQAQGGEKLDLSHSTRNVRVHMGDFFQNLSNRATFVYAKSVRTQQEIRVIRKNMQSRLAPKQYPDVLLSRKTAARVKTVMPPSNMKIISITKFNKLSDKQNSTITLKNKLLSKVL